jgi:predicted small lipoprotein YifL
MKETMKKNLAWSTLILIVTGTIAGCGNSAPQTPHTIPPPFVDKPHQGPWTKADKIAVIQRSGLSGKQKKAMIDGLNAGPG